MSNILGFFVVLNNQQNRNESQIFPNQIHWSNSFHSIVQEEMSWIKIICLKYSQK